ncbi:MAG: hypothetical protein V1834_02825, partial [Candidatus Micrarchaeota archaeon]
MAIEKIRSHLKEQESPEAKKLLGLIEEHGPKNLNQLNAVMEYKGKGITNPQSPEAYQHRKLT